MQDSQVASFIGVSPASNDDGRGEPLPTLESMSLFKRSVRLKLLFDHSLSTLGLVLEVYERALFTEGTTAFVKLPGTQPTSAQAQEEPLSGREPITLHPDMLPSIIDVSH